MFVHCTYFTRHNKHLETRKHLIFEPLNMKRSISIYIYIYIVLKERHRPSLLVRNHLNLYIFMKNVSLFHLNIIRILMVCMELIINKNFLRQNNFPCRSQISYSI